MIPPQFEYFAPSSVSEAVELLERYDGEAKVLAGGMSLIPILKLRLAEPAALIDIGRIEELSYIREEDGWLRIGAGTIVNDLHDSDLVRERYPILHDATSVIADPLVDNMGTVGGNIAHGDPANDLPACMLVLGAQVVAQGPKGSRTIPVREFFIDTFETALEDNEILTEVQVPTPRPRQGNAYMKIEKRAGDFSIAAVAANVILDAKGTVEDAGIGLTSVAPTPTFAVEASNHLAGGSPDEAAIARAAELAEKVANPVSDLRGPAEYKRAMVGVLTRRTLNKALARAGGG
ncbi:MAG: xanthine dehydrogenase family protein subunit M [Thermoplasmata archaeon]|nr:xanthine dehydrogenase family protein subunit M [Thermoplasmata archaeon]